MARYIIRMANGELFGWNPDWLKIPGMVEYDPAIHGYRSEVTAQMGLVMPVAPVAAPVVEAPKPVAGGKTKKATAAVELAPTQTTPAEPDLSDVFNAK